MSNQLLLNMLREQAASRLNTTTINSTKEDVVQKTITTDEVIEETVTTTEVNQEEEVTNEVVEEATTEVTNNETTDEIVEETTTEVDQEIANKEVNQEETSKNSSSAIMALMAQRQVKDDKKNNRSSQSATKNNKKEAKVFEHVSEIEGIIYLYGSEIGRFPKQALIPNADYDKYIREEIIPHVKQAKMSEFKLRPEGADWHLEPKGKFQHQG